MAEVLHNQSYTEIRSTGFAGKDSSMAKGEDSSAEDLGLPAAAAAHHLVQREDAADPTGSSQAEVSHLQAVAAVHWVNPSHHHDPRHSCSQSLQFAAHTTHRNPAKTKNQKIHPNKKKI